MNNGNSFDWNQQIFPKILRAAGYHTALYGKSHLKGKPQGFDSWAVLPGQGDYYNPAMLTPEGRKVINGYCTDIVTDMAIHFIKESKELGKPFMLMCQHKAPHRTWMPALRHLNLYDDIKIPEPKTLFDQYESRIPAQHQEMEIDRHMYLDHDLFTDLTPDLKIPKQRRPSEDRSAYLNMKRMTPEQLKIWRAAYGPKDKAFREAKLTGRELVRWKFQRYAKNYLRSIKGVDENNLKIDEIITEKLSEKWSLERLSKTEISVFRLAVYELCYNLMFSKKTVINEYISIFEAFGGNTDFANGILENISQNKNDK